MLIDTHAHLTMSEYNLDLEEVLKRAKNAGVEYIINAAFDIDSSIKSVELSKNHENIFASVGVHPHHADLVDEKIILKLDELCKNEKVVAIGETGLDYFENPIPKDVQKKAFLLQLELAQKNNLPVILHGRDANDDMLELLKGKNIKGVFHCFSQDKSYAKKVIDMGFYISFTGIVTFKNAHVLREVAEFIPIDFVMLETDCPYLAPQIFRGKRNEPSYLRYIAQKIAEIKKMDYEKLSNITTQNAINFFSIKC